MTTRLTVIARWISNIMNPFPITVVLLLLVSYTGSANLHIFIIWALIILSCFIALPFTYIYVKNFVSKYNKVRLQEPTAFFREHKNEILILGLISAIVLIPMLIFLRAPSTLFSTFAVLVATCLAIAVVNRHYKASFHLAVITNVSIIIAVLWGQKALPIIAIIPLVGWARYFLRQHSPYQLATGFGLAAIVSLPILYYFNHDIYLNISHIGF